MSNPIWSKTLSEVLGHETYVHEYISEKTGNAYTQDTIALLNVLSTGSVIQDDNGEYRYSIVDTEKELEYTIKTSNHVNVSFGTPLTFTLVRGGVIGNKGLGWYKAESVKVNKHEEKV